MDWFHYSASEIEIFAIESVLRMNIRKELESNKLGKPNTIYSIWESKKGDNNLKEYSVLMISFDIQQILDISF